MSKRPLTHDDYTVGWISPLEVEQIAAVAMLDEQHPSLHQSHVDSNSYTLGSIKGHNVVIAGLPTPGNNSAATVVAYMRSTFPNLKFNLLVGTAGGVPSRTSDDGPIRLGHVVVSKPHGQHSGAVQYDSGKAQAAYFERTGSLAPPPNAVLNAAQTLAVFRASALEDPLLKHLKRIDTSLRGLKRYRHPGPGHDHLYQPDYVHADKSLSCQECGCDTSKRVIRPAGSSEYDSDDDREADENDSEHDEQWVTVHRGTIASGELKMRNGVQRDQLAKQHEVLCFEMEAVGAANDFPCLVVRGISNYADSHQDDKWQGYAASVAAAYARELFTYMPLPKSEPPSNIFANLNIKADNYDAAVRNAILHDRTGAVKELLSKRLDISSALEDRIEGSLDDAFDRGYLEIANLLLDNQVGVGNTLLALASYARKIEVVNSLRDAGASDFDNALMMASKGGDTEIVRLLTERAAQTRDKLRAQ